MLLTVELMSTDVGIYFRFSWFDGGWTLSLLTSTFIIKEHRALRRKRSDSWNTRRNHKPKYCQLQQNLITNTNWFLNNFSNYYSLSSFINFFSHFALISWNNIIHWLRFKIVTLDCIDSEMSTLVIKSEKFQIRVDPWRCE